MVDAVRMEPMDRYNEALVAGTHPPDWVNPTPSDRYNLVVIGAGTAGLVAAAGAAGLGAKVALVEKHLLGGDCLNFGCVPSKCLLASAHALADARRAGALGVRTEAEVDFPAVMERMRRLRSRIAEHDSASRFRDLGVDVFLGAGRFVDSRTIEVDGTKLHFARALIATGARAVHPETEGLEDAGYHTNETVFSMTTLPRRLGVFGAGPIGCELAQAFRRFGSEVHLFQRPTQLLPREDPDATEILHKRFLEEGIHVHLGTEVARVSVAGGEKRLHAVREEGETTIAVDEILIGAGRAPNVEGLGLQRVDVAYDPRSGVHVNDRLQTTNPRIYAAGDICLRQKFTHAADATARIALQNALFWGRKKLSALTIPWCTYTDPAIAHVGLYAHEAEARGIELTTFTRSLGEVDRAIADGQEEGFVKVHVHKGTDRIAGATIVARRAGDLIGELTLAMVAGVGLGKLGGVIHPYPTQAEAIKHVGDACNRTRLTPFLKGLFGRILAWRR
jgi:pyruvate/2-oxoglutarate dehydrogenase complex dihydrolipoamide dehydrogenase (E3) component